MRLFERKKTLAEYADKPAREINVSYAEFQDLRDKFNALCQHLGVRVERPYHPQVTKIGVGGIQSSTNTTSESLG